MARMGMDVDQITAAGNALKQRAADIDTLVTKIDGIVRSMPGIWDGPDAQQFVNEWWPEHKKTLVAASSHVAGLGQSALNNASEQREVSGTRGGGFTTPGDHVPDQPGRGPLAPTSPGGTAKPGETVGVLPWQGGRDGYIAKIGNPEDEHLDGMGAYSGNCTSWAAYRREELGLPWRPSANVGTGTGAEMADRMGGSADSPPTLGAIVSMDPTNHVMIVEEVHPDGSFRVSEMNVPDPNDADKSNNLGNLSTSRTFTRLPDGRWQGSPKWEGPQSLVFAP